VLLKLQKSHRVAPIVRNVTVITKVVATCVAVARVRTFSAILRRAREIAIATVVTDNDAFQQAVVGVARGRSITATIANASIGCKTARVKAKTTFVANDCVGTGTTGIGIQTTPTFKLHSGTVGAWAIYVVANDCNVAAAAANT
jgi:hypothetical protein